MNTCTCFLFHLLQLVSKFIINYTCYYLTEKRTRAPWAPPRIRHWKPTGFALQTVETSGVKFSKIFLAIENCRPSSLLKWHVTYRAGLQTSTHVVTLNGTKQLMFVARCKVTRKFLEDKHNWFKRTNIFCEHLAESWQNSAVIFLRFLKTD